MADVIEANVPVLRIQVQSAPDSSAATLAAFEVLRGSDAPTKIAAEPTTRLGLPDVITSRRDITEDELQIPDELLRQILSALREVATFKDPVYLLDLPAPRGYLHLVPWERLLAEHLPVPLVRLPRYELVPHAKWPLIVAIVAGCSPHRTPFSVKAAVAHAVSDWRNTFPDKDLIIDIFVPAGDCDGVRNIVGAHADMQSSGAATHKVTVHDPPHETTIGWRAWIGSALEGRAIDILQLIGHGSFRGDRGVLALPSVASEPPEQSVSIDADGRTMFGKAPERSIDAPDLCAALTSLGAWSVLITAPAENASPAGLRDLATAITETRPGVVILHQHPATPAGAVRVTQSSQDQAEESLRMITGKIPEAAMPDVSCWHPLITAWFTTAERSANESAADAALTEPDGTSALISNYTLSVLAAPDAPGWVASGARTLETLHAQMIGSAGGSPNPDAIDALRNVSDSFNEQVRQWSNQHGETGIS
ncbi:hypothetical protein FHT44_006259 [Mycolicibacterium sp. BK634]|uniref:hypothetical protein n=1 Tax=Mycolicibacterium sp. BK634 TaxID=2587099 RepID=UPI000D3B1CC1|nr:hypothetical protein [Mycolicibacterium sp. BK634]MBB3753737.1 hypothetical protein [Mycolicibacterium sp. BK634]